MKKLGFWFFFIVLLLSVNLLSGQAANNPRNMYDIKQGDTLWKIANTYKTTVEDLKLMNGLQSDLLLPGQKLRVPIFYEIKANDTLWKLANSFNSTVDLIKTANDLKTDKIFIGQIIQIPPKKLKMNGQFILLTREEFKDWLFNHSFTRKIGKIQHHHTYQPEYRQFTGNNHFQLLKGMEYYHVKEMGWKAISQQITTFPDGTIAIGRPFNMPPEGSFGFKNKEAMEVIEQDSIAIENLGNFDSGNNAMTAEQKESIVTVTALLMLKFGLTPSIDTITYHHWWDINTGERVLDNSKGHSVKTCPGTNFFGGNSTKAAKNNLYTLVIKKMEENGGSVPQNSKY